MAAGQIDLAPLENMLVNQAVVQGAGIRVVVSVFSPFGEAPLTPLARDEYCTYISRLVTRYPQINDVVIWNEPNLRFFWKPQFDLDGQSEAPRATSSCSLTAGTSCTPFGLRSTSSRRRHRRGGTTTRTRSRTSRTRRRPSSRRWAPRIAPAGARVPSSTRSATTRIRRGRTNGRGQRTATRQSSRSATSTACSCGCARRSAAPGSRRRTRRPDLVPGDGLSDADRR